MLPPVVVMFHDCCAPFCWMYWAKVTGVAIAGVSEPMTKAQGTTR